MRAIWMVAVAAALAVPAASAKTQFPSPATSASRAAVVSRHSGTFNGRKLSYTAMVETIDVIDSGGGARLVDFAYLADSTAPAARPVIFLFNGGPIVPSTLLHLGAFGPMRVAFPDDVGADSPAFKLIDNGYSPLDAADLVFIDPASTGYSRVISGTDPKSYHSVAADGRQVAGLISRWLDLHGRRGSPIYLLGESYGTIRAAEVARQLSEMPKPTMVSGVILLGQALNIVEYVQRPANIMSYVVSLPTLAAAAWYHNKVDRAGRTVEQFTEEARKFAGSDYLDALFQGTRLSEADRQRVARRLEAYSGIPAAYYLSHNLRISKMQFRRELLADRGLLLGNSDARYTAPITEKGVAADPSDLLMAAVNRLFPAYLREQLKVDWADPYVPSAEVSGLDAWAWGGTSPFSDWPFGAAIGKLMAADPKFRVFVANGYYDMQTTVGAADYLISQSGWPTDRATLKFYEGGHAAYTAEGQAKAFTDDVRSFVLARN